MIKTAFLSIVFVHGLIHFIGFLKGFRIAEIGQLSTDIPKVMGLLWLLAAVLFIIAATLLLVHGTWWPIGLVAVAISQFLILVYWQDAKIGTVANVIILVGIILSFGKWQFHKSVADEVGNLTSSVPSQNERGGQIPDLVQKWLDYTNEARQPAAPIVHIRQQGSMRQQPDGAWHAFHSEQWTSVYRPAFIWEANMETGYGLHVAIRDKYQKGKGNMLVKLFSLIKIDEASGAEIDQGAMLRYLGELVWVPAAAHNNFIKWQAIDKLSALATISHQGKNASAIFKFNENGQVSSVQAKRYYYKKEGSTLEDWRVEVDTNSYRQLNGINVPTRVRIIWQLESGDFEWYRAEIQQFSYLQLL